jgi:hypothetical protein
MNLRLERKKILTEFKEFDKKIQEFAHTWFCWLYRNSASNNIADRKKNFTLSAIIIAINYSGRA